MLKTTGHFFEIYTKGPNGEDGWDIKVGFVFGAKSTEDAIQAVKNRFGSKFSEIIQCHYTCVSPLGCKTTIIHAR